jgi:hypothetical protein
MRGDNVSSLVKNVFVILGVMMISTLLFSVVFSGLGRSLIWGAIEPVFQSTWMDNTMQDGSLVDKALTEDFDSLIEVPN